MENPYRPPKTPPSKPAPPKRKAPKHRSFRLTLRNDSETGAVEITFADAFIYTLGQQLFLVMLTAMFLDGGLALRRVGIASIVFWIVTFVILARSWRAMPYFSMLFIKWGYLVVMIVTWILLNHLFS